LHPITATEHFAYTTINANHETHRKTNLVFTSSKLTANSPLQLFIFSIFWF